MGKENALCKVRDDSACAQNGESHCFRVSLRQPQGQLCRLSLLLLLSAAKADIPTPLALRQGFSSLGYSRIPGCCSRAIRMCCHWAWFSSGSSFSRLWWNWAHSPSRGLSLTGRGKSKSAQQHLNTLLTYYWIVCIAQLASGAKHFPYFSFLSSMLSKHNRALWCGELPSWTVLHPSCHPSSGTPGWKENRINQITSQICSAHALCWPCTCECSGARGVGCGDGGAGASGATDAPVEERVARCAPGVRFTSTAQHSAWCWPCAPITVWEPRVMRPCADIDMTEQKAKVQ